MRDFRCLAVATLCALALQAPAGEASADVFTPGSDDVVLERLPSSVRTARELRARVLRDADRPDLQSALATAREHVRLARSDGDPRQHGYAQSALSRWWALGSPPTEVLVLRAVIKQARHDFDGALADLSLALTTRPDHAQAWLTRATILRVRGELTRSRAACRAMLRVSAPLAAATCVCAASASAGQASHAHDALASMLARTSHSEPELRQWSLTVLGELALATGDVQRAEQHFQRALALTPRSVYLLARYADLLLDEGRAREAHALLDGDAAADVTLLRLALAARALGLSKHLDHARELEQRLEAARRRGDAVHLRVAARAALSLRDDPARALTLALENWQLQREPSDARLILEAADAAGRPDAARVVLEWMRIEQVQDRRLDALVERIEEGRHEPAS